MYFTFNSILFLLFSLFGQTLLGTESIVCVHMCVCFEYVLVFVCVDMNLENTSNVKRFVSFVWIKDKVDVDHEHVTYVYDIINVPV